MEYEKGNEPKFNLIIGAKSLTELGFVLDFETQNITIDKIDLTMIKLAELQNPIMVNNLNKATEPISTLFETERNARILDEKYKKSNLP